MGSCQSKNSYEANNYIFKRPIGNPLTDNIANQSILDEKQIGNEPLCPITNQEKLAQILHRSIVAIRISIKHSVRNIRGNGVLLSKNMLLTVAHNLFDRYQGQYDKTKYRIYIGSDGSKHYEVEDWRYSKQFMTITNPGQRDQYDYALIKLKENPTNPVNYSEFLCLALPCKCILNKKEELVLHIFGFPSFKENYQPLDTEGFQIRLCQYGLSKNDSIIQIKDDYLIEHSVSTMPGQSGCPIVVDNRIVAIHKGAKRHQLCNVGRLITLQMITNLQKWCKQLEGDSFKVITDKKCWHIHDNHQEQRQPNGPHQDKINSGEIQLIKGQNIQKIEKLQSFAGHYSNEYNYEVALQNYNWSLVIKEKINGRESIQVADVIHLIGGVYYDQFRYNMALKCFYQALQTYQNLNGKGCFESANTLHHIGMAYDDQLNYTKALDYYSQALQIKERVKGKGCLESANTLNNMGIIYKTQYKYAKALKYYKESKSIYQKNNSQSREYGHTLFNMAIFYYDVNEHQASSKLFEQSLKIFQQLNISNLVNLCSALLAQSLTVVNQKASFRKLLNKG